MSPRELFQAMQELRLSSVPPTDPLPEGCSQKPATHDPMEQEWDYEAMFDVREGGA